MLSKQISASMFAAVSVSLSVALFAQGVAQTVTVTETDSAKGDGIKAFKTRSPFSGSNSPAGTAVGMSGPGAGKVAFSNKTNTAFSGTTGPKPSKAIGDTSVDVTFPVAGEPEGAKSDKITVVEIDGILEGKVIALKRADLRVTIKAISPPPSKDLVADFYKLGDADGDDKESEDLKILGKERYKAKRSFFIDNADLLDGKIIFYSAIDYLGLTFTTEKMGVQGKSKLFIGSFK